MTKAGKKILDAVEQTTRAIRTGNWEGFVIHVPDQIDVKAVRRELGMTQQAFAKRFGLGYDAVRDWEAGRRQPERGTRVLLQVIRKNPKAVEDALNGAS